MKYFAKCRQKVNTILKCVAIAIENVDEQYADVGK